MRLIEIRLLDGPSVYRPEPVVKVEVAIGRRRSWYGPRVPARHLLVRLGAAIPRRDWPEPVATLTGWAARLRREHGEGTGGIRVHRSSDPGHWIATWPWSGAERARLIAEAAASLSDRSATPARRARLTGTQEKLLAGWEDRIAGASATPPPWVRDVDRRIPIVSISGTNGKSTTTRLITRILLRAGRRVGTTTSDGILVDERMVEPGDWTGPGGAKEILERSDVDVAVLETARGGILLRGIGVLHNDVAIVTNVSEDHLGLHGIQTIDQLAEVKASVTRITRPDGWDVLNADDPRVLSMRRVATGRPWLCSLDPWHPAIRDALAEGGRATVPLDGWMTVLDGSTSRPLLELMDVPVTIAGISRHNVMNAMQAASAAIGIGLPERAVVKGLTTFVTDPERNPGRANLFELDGRVVVVDYAHNEAGMLGLTEICAGLRRSGGEIWLVICAAGDRTDQILHAFAYRAARGSDHLAIAELLRYLRGRAREETVQRLVAGARDGGAEEIDVYADELSGLRGVLARSRKRDVIGVTALGMRPEVFAWLDGAGATRMTAARVRRVVRSARGS